MYLNFDSINELSHRLDSAPVETRLLQYGSSYWGLYARNGFTEWVRSLSVQLLGKFGRNTPAKLLSREGYGEMWGSWRYSAVFTGLHCIAYLGLDEMAVALLEEVLVEGCGADIDDRLGRTPLAWAADIGHERVVKLLQARAGAESGIGPNDVPMLPSYFLENSSEGLLVSQLSPQPPGVPQTCSLKILMQHSCQPFLLRTPPIPAQKSPHRPHHLTLLP